MLYLSVLYLSLCEMWAHVFPPPTCSVLGSGQSQPLHLPDSTAAHWLPAPCLGEEERC